MCSSLCVFTVHGTEITVSCGGTPALAKPGRDMLHSLCVQYTIINLEKAASGVIASTGLHLNLSQIYQNWAALICKELKNTWYLLPFSSFFIVSQRTRNGMKHFPLAFSVANTGCELQGVSSAIKCIKMWLSLDIIFSKSPDMLVTAPVRSKGGEAGFCCLSGAMIQCLSCCTFFICGCLFFSLSRIVL